MGNFQVRFFHTRNRDPDKFRNIFDGSVQHLKLAKEGAGSDPNNLTEDLRANSETTIRK